MWKLRFINSNFNTCSNNFNSAAGLLLKRYVGNNGMRETKVSPLISPLEIPNYIRNQKKLVQENDDDDDDNVDGSSKEMKKRSVLGNIANDYVNAAMGLSKFKLAALVASTTAVGFVMATTEITRNVTCWEFTSCLVGTSLAIASANSFNQWYEYYADAQMQRTQTRVIPTGKVTPAFAAGFGLVTGASGIAILAMGNNEVTAILGLLNIILYSAVYTPMKRHHVLNTWVGAVVGGIPPMMGYSAVTGSGVELGSLTLFYLLYIWQIPHFFSLSWLIRKEYANVGYKMLIVSDVAKAAKLSLRYCFYLLPFGPLCYYSGITDPYFIVDSTLLTAAFCYKAKPFYEIQSRATARKLFLTSIMYLPAMLSLLVIHRQGNLEILQQLLDGII